MKDRPAPRGSPPEPHYEIGLNPDFQIEDVALRTSLFVEWVRERLGITKCATLSEVLAIRAQRAKFASDQRTLIAKIDDAFVVAEALRPTRTAAQLREAGITLTPSPDGRCVRDEEEIMDMVAGHLHHALWIARLRLKKQELRAPIRLEGTPPRLDVELMRSVHEVTGLPFAEVVRRVYAHVANPHGERDSFVASEIRALQKARQRRRSDTGRKRVDSGG